MTRPALPDPPSVLSALPDLVYILEADGLIADILNLGSYADQPSVAGNIGQHVSEVFPPEEAARYRAILAKTLETGASQSLEYPFELADGLHWVEARTACLRGKHGEPDRIVWIPRDITARHEAEVALAESNDRLRAMIDAYPDVAFLLDHEGRVLFLNRISQERFGVREEDVRGREIWGLIDPLSVSQRQAAGRSVVETGKPIHFEESVHGRLLDTYILPVFDRSGTVSGVAVYSIDITDRPDSERIRSQVELRLRHQQRLESIGTLASGIAHEINNPINIIMNYGELILDHTNPGSEVQRYAEAVIQESQRIAGIVRNLLDFARPEKEAPRPTDLNQVVSATLSLVREILHKNRIELRTRLAPDLPAIQCRPKQIMQVLMNLVTNARDALNERFPGHDPAKVLSVSSEALAVEGRPFLRVTVADGGVGMPPDVAERIFDPFFTTKSRAEGTGLGLAVSHGIVAEHRGFLRVNSRLGEGTCFYVDLPLDGGAA